MDGPSARAMLIFEGRSSSSSHSPGATPCRSRPHRQVPVSRAAAMPGLVHDPRRVLTRIDRLTAAFPALDLGPDALQAGEELRLVVERCHHMPPFPTLRVIPEVVSDEPPDGVIVRVNPGHRPRVSLHRPPRIGPALASNPAVRRRPRPYGGPTARSLRDPATQPKLADVCRRHRCAAAVHWRWPCRDSHRTWREPRARVAA